MSDLAKRIEDHLACIAKEDLEVAIALHSALQTQQGRKAAGLKPKGRGKTYDPKRATIESAPFTIALDFALGYISEDDALARLVDYMGASMDERTAKKYLDDIMPSAASFAAVLLSAK